MAQFKLLPLHYIPGQERLKAVTACCPVRTFVCFAQDSLTVEKYHKIRQCQKFSCHSVVLELTVAQ